MDFDQTEFMIVDKMSEFCIKAYSEGLSDGQWTIGIKTLLAGIGDSINCKTCASGVEGREGEWLYDLIWYKSSHDGKLTEITLVLESEWLFDIDELIYDFEKLLIAKSKYKLFIFQAANNNDIINIYNILNSHILAYNDNYASERYLFAALNLTDKKFEFIQTLN